MYQYSFISTTSDLLDAKEAGRTARWARAPFRLLLIVLGIVWFIAGIVTFNPSNLIGRSIIWLLLGTGVIYYFLINPLIIRSRIKKSAGNYELVIEFDNDRININAGDTGRFLRKWEELTSFVDAKKGIVFYFDDGIVNWLPNRVFNGKTERDKFLGFLRDKKNQSNNEDIPQKIL